MRKLMEGETIDVVDGVEYINTKHGFRFARCCGNAKCDSECRALIYHGPGHQSKTHCLVKGSHKVHVALYGSHRQLARWRGDEVFSGFFDEPPDLDEEE